MFQQMFAEMNEMLQEVEASLPTAEGSRRGELLCKYQLLRRMTDDVLDEWLAFAEKLSRFRETADMQPESPEQAPPEEAPELSLEAYARGQGYYKLLMFRECIGQFEEVIAECPDSLSARLYLGMAHMRLGEDQAAWDHLHHMLPLVRDGRIKAMLYNALGCIMAAQEHFAEAAKLFTASARLDPALPEPILNLEVCRLKQGELHFGSRLVSML